MTQNNSVKSIIAWCLYDFANSAYFSVVTTFIFAAYFTSKIAENNILGTHQWANATAIAGIMIAILSPIVGAIADFGGYRKVWLAIFTYIGIITTALLWYAKPEISYVTLTLTLYIVSDFAIEIATVFYNALLTVVARDDYIGRISGWGWGVGYIGGLICLSIALFVFIDHPPSWLNTNTLENVRINGPLVAIWFFIFSIPLFLYVHDHYKKSLPFKSAITQGFTQLSHTLKKSVEQKNVFLYLMAHMIYIDGLNTLFVFGGIYASGTFGMSMAQVVQFGIILNVTAGIGAAIFSWIDDWLGAKFTVLFSLFALIILGIGILSIHSVFYFWILAPTIGLFVGPTQAASRSLLARIVKREQITEMFGLYQLTGKATSFLNPWILGLVTLHFNSQRIGMSTIFIFFVIGAVMLCFVKE